MNDFPTAGDGGKTSEPESEPPVPVQIIGNAPINKEYDRQRRKQKCNYYFREAPPYIEAACAICLIFITLMYTSYAGQQVGAIRDQLQQMKTASAQAKQDNLATINAQKDIAQAGLTASQIAIREQARLDQRAWLGIDNIVGEAKLGEVATITAYLKNTGKSPAKQVMFFTCDKPVFRGQQLVITYDKIPASEYSRGIIPPNSTYRMSPPAPSAAMNQHTLDMIKNRDVVEYIYGKGTYRDVFGCGHWLTYCSYLASDAKSWAPCGQYNDTGDDKCSLGTQTP